MTDLDLSRAEVRYVVSEKTVRLADFDTLFSFPGLSTGMYLHDAAQTNW